MDLECLIGRMRGKYALVNGTRHLVGLDGIMRDVKAADADELLLCSHEWCVAPGTKVETPKTPKAQEPASEDEPDLEAMDFEQLQALADKLGVEYGHRIGEEKLRERIEEKMTE